MNAIVGVERAETHIKDGVVIVTMKDGFTLDRTATKAAIEAAGFTLEDFAAVGVGDDR